MPSYPHVVTLIPNSSWRGTISLRTYFAPRDCAESVENQELKLDREHRAQRDRGRGTLSRKSAF